MIDLAIIGSGPASLSAAVYAARAGLDVVIYEQNRIGGALTEIAQIENYPGFFGAGSDLAENMKKQALDAGAKIEYGECESITKDENFKLIIDGEEVESRTVLVATGSEPKKLNIEGIEKPISYCALCDGALYKDKDIVVVGSGNSAFQESIYLAKIAKTVTILAKAELKAEPYLLEKMKACENIIVKEMTESTAELLNTFDGIFVFIGKQPATSFLPEEILSEDKYIKTENYMTDIPGLFAAGDVRDGSIKQAVSASSEGAAAALAISNFLKG